MRKKKQSNYPQVKQLSLFDDYLEDQEHNSKVTDLQSNWQNVINKIENIKSNDNNISEDKQNRQQSIVNNNEQRGNTGEREPAVEKPTDLRDDTGTTARAVFTDEIRQNVNPIFGEDRDGMAGGDRSASGFRNGEISSGRSGVGQSSGESRFDLTNFHSDKSPFVTNTFNKREKYSDNLRALQILVEIDRGYLNVTSDIQQELAKYVGWGGLKEILLNPDADEEWQTTSIQPFRPLIKDILRNLELLDPDGSLGLLNAAKRSILNAHYTSYPIINGIYDGIRKAGFKGGKILEPSAGIGNFLAAMPEDIANASDVSAIEMDRLSGMILQKLFPTAQTHINGFEKLTLPFNNYDLIISNIPFGDISLFDPQLFNLKDKSFNLAADNIHNFFFAKSILLARPGGMIAFVTSRYTLDSQSGDAIRKLIADNCEFCGAIRLPDTAFEGNAGTQVVSDIIFLRKFELGESRLQKHNFLSVKSIPFTDNSGNSGMISYNEYYHQNPGNMIGTIEFGGLYRKDEFNLKGDKSIDIQGKIDLITDKLFPNPILKVRTEEPSKRSEEAFIKLLSNETVGNLVDLDNGVVGVISDTFYIDHSLDQIALRNGISPEKIRLNKDKLTLREEDILKSVGLSVDDFQMRVVNKVKLGKDQIPKVKLLQQIRRGAKELLYREGEGHSDGVLNPLRNDLRETYESFVLKFGNLSHPDNLKVINLDIDASFLRALEKKDTVTNKIIPADLFYQRTVKQKKEIYHTEHLSDAIGISLEKYGYLQMNYICELMDIPYEELMSTQTGDNTLIFLDEHGNHITREAYLSGNVVKKLKDAQQYLIDHPFFQNNVDQLISVQPAPIDAVDIDIMLHARWVPKDIIEDFVKHLFQTKSFKLSFSPSKSNYTLNLYDYTGHIDSFATERKKADWIFNHAVNGIEPKVTYTIEIEKGKTETIFDAADTQLAKESYNRIIQQWDDWKYQDFDRRERLADIYNSTYNTTILRTYDGSHLNFPGLVGYTLRDHQKDCVFRNITTNGGVNDHIVGAGKTLVQIATAMELRRLGKANKPMITGLKSQIPQLYESFKQAYPLAKVLFPKEKDFKKENRKQLLNTIATNDWDCIIISHDQFMRLEQPVEIQVDLIKELTDVIREEMRSLTDKNELKSAEKRLYKYEQKIQSLLNTPKDKGVLDFSSLGVDFLMVDESQEFKNLEFSTILKNIRGMGSPSGSKKAFNMLVACRYLQKLWGGDEGILFCSGTPISNTMAELYLLFKYLRPTALKERGINSFDSWSAVFAKVTTNLEYYMGRFKEVHRLGQFVNLPELLTMYREMTDVRNNHNLKLDKPKAEHILVKIQPSESQLKKIEDLQVFIESKGVELAEELGLTAGYDEKRNMNPSFALLAINYAKKISMDPRLIDPKDKAGDKLNIAASKVMETYLETTSFKGTQLIFSDIGTPKAGNTLDNLYDYLSQNDTFGLSQSDIGYIFGEGYAEKSTKPPLEGVKSKVSEILNIDRATVEDILTESNIEAPFDVYNEIKNLLIFKGIPENQIVFIHDYKTAKQKDLLYDAVNAGDVRIVIGSTKKLGVGVNVQKRAVAVHHLDIPWRPSDVEQRNGRVERQGNIVAKDYLNNTVKMYYYATERTLDASMYNTVSIKGNFIAQMKTVGNSTIRTIKDIEEDIDMGAMAAELSGDPIFKEKADLTKSIADLETMQKAYQSKKFATESKLRNAERLVSEYNEEIAIIEKTLPFIDKINLNDNGEKIFSAHLDGKEFGKMGEYGAAVLKVVENALKRLPTGSAFPLGEVWGFKIVGELNWSVFDQKNSVNRKIYNPLGVQLDEGLLSSNEVSLAVQITRSILKLPSELVNKKNKREKTILDIQQYKDNLNHSFPHLDELLQKRTRMTEIIRIIKNRTDLEEGNNNVGQKHELTEVSESSSGLKSNYRRKI